MTLSTDAADSVGDAPDAATRFATLPERVPLHDYNFEHFTTKYLWRDARRTLEKRGVLAGEMAPDFELPRVGGGTLRLSGLRGRPTLLHFGSVS